MAPVIINFTARIRIDLCDKGLDPSLLGQELLVMAVFLLGLDTVLVIWSFRKIISQGFEAWKARHARIWLQKRLTGETLAKAPLCKPICQFLAFIVRRNNAGSGMLFRRHSVPWVADFVL
jgi:hypothetical protein